MSMQANEREIDIESPTNQTEFFESELVESTPPEYPTEPDTRSDEERQTSTQRKKRTILLLTAMGVLLSFGGAGVVLLSPEAQSLRVPVASPRVVQPVATSSAVLQRLESVELQIQAADPVVSQLPLPAVSFTLSLDQAQR